MRLRLWSVKDPLVSRSNLFVPTVAVFAVLPAASVIFPELLSSITNFGVSANERQTAILELLLLKRVYLYTLALVALDWSSKRSVELVDQPLGLRFLTLNQELLANLGNVTDSYASLEKDANRPLYDALDKIEGSQQAVALPFLLGGSLVASFAFLTLSSRLALPTNADSESSFALVQTFGTSLLTGLSLLSNGAVSFLFSKAELQALQNRWAPQLPTGTSTAAAGALCLTAFASGLGSAAWPVQNMINVMLAVTACRACALSRFRYVVPALFGLMAYDWLAVSGTAVFTDGGESIMEAVAVAKVAAASTVAGGTAAGGGAATAGASVGAALGGAAASGTWRPGLFQVVVGGRVSDALGLADVIFPALLAGWALRFDSLRGGSVGLYRASLGGFVIGCVALELLQTGQGGQPALLYLVPAMLASVGLAGARAGVLKNMWEL